MNTITLKQTECIKAVLCNDENSSDQELLEYFTQVLQVDEKTANQYLRMRKHFLNNLFVDKFLSQH